MKRIFLAAGSLVVAAGAILAVVAGNRIDADVGQQSRAAELALGAAIYADACAGCHGADLEGEPEWHSPGPDGRMPAPPHDASGHTWHHPDRVLLQIMLSGTSAVVGNGHESNMPGFAQSHSEQELRAVLDWIKSQWPERERSYQARITAEDIEPR